MVEGADGLAGGLYPQAVRQVEGLNSIIECGRAIVGGTGGVGQGTRVDGGLRSIIVDVGSEGGLLSIFAASASLLATAACAASLSLGRSVSARTAVGPALLLLLLPLGLLLLLLGELGVSRCESKCGFGSEQQPKHNTNKGLRKCASGGLPPRCPERMC